MKLKNMNHPACPMSAKGENKGKTERKQTQRMKGNESSEELIILLQSLDPLLLGARSTPTFVNYIG